LNENNKGDPVLSPSTALPDAAGRPPRKSVLRTMSSYFRQPRNDVARLKRTREVASQCFWYAGAFYINWVALSVRSTFFDNCPSVAPLTGKESFFESIPFIS